MKLGLVGLGYWGKIILKNLRELGYDNITICETQPIDWGSIGSKYPVVKSYKELECDKVFVVTPPHSHFDICQHFLESGIDVFCEKPLTTDSDSSTCLYTTSAYHLAGSLFVDWIFTFNPCVAAIKKIIYEYGFPKNIIGNRLNYGPARHDVSARWDLASHDVSIALHLLGKVPKNVQWIDFKRNSSSKQQDSTVGILSFERQQQTCNVQINASWEYGKKDRTYSLEFDNGFVYWDDSTASVKSDFCECYVEDISPLHNSINSFIHGAFCPDLQKELTLNTIEVLNK